MCEVQKVIDLSVCRLLVHRDHSLSGLFVFLKGVSNLYRPQYLEQKYELMTAYSGERIVYQFLRPLKKNTYKRKENNEVLPFRGGEKNR